jgi:hypothetical protein
MNKERRGYHHQLAGKRTRIFPKKQQRNTYSIASEPKRRHGDSKVTHCCRTMLGPHCWPSNYQRRTIRRLYKIFNKKHKRTIESTIKAETISYIVKMKDVQLLGDGTVAAAEVRAAKDV